jgi:hypothetical protein
VGGGVGAQVAHEQKTGDIGHWLLLLVVMTITECGVIVKSTITIDV